MYNGIGVQTPRGTGTNGYVQRNFAFIRHRKDKVEYKTEEDIARLERTLQKKPNKEILEHQWKRNIELQCVQLRDDLEEQGYTESEIDQQVDALRSRLRQETAQNVGGPGSWDTHHIAAATEKKNEKFREAFGISKDYVGGSAFDPGHKALKAAQREEERLKREEAKASAVRGSQTHALLPDLSEVDSPESEIEEEEVQHKVKKQKLSSNEERRKKRSRKVSTSSSSSSASDSSDASSVSSRSVEERVRKTRQKTSPRKRSNKKGSVSPAAKKRHEKNGRHSPCSPVPEPTRRRQNESPSGSSPSPQPRKRDKELRSPSPPLSRNKHHPSRGQRDQPYSSEQRRRHHLSSSPVSKKRHRQQSKSPVMSRHARHSPEQRKQYHQSRSSYAHHSSRHRHTSSSQSSSLSPKFKDQRGRKNVGSLSPAAKELHSPKQQRYTYKYRSPPRDTFRGARSPSSCSSSLSPKPRGQVRGERKDYQERRPSPPNRHSRHDSPKQRSQYHRPHSSPPRSRFRHRDRSESSSSFESSSPEPSRDRRHERKHCRRGSPSPRGQHSPGTRSPHRKQSSRPSWQHRQSQSPQSPLYPSPRHHRRDDHYHQQEYSAPPRRQSRRHSPEQRRHNRQSDFLDRQHSSGHHHRRRDHQYDSDSSVE